MNQSILLPLIFAGLLSLPLVAIAITNVPNAIMLANHYSNSLDMSLYLVSEKYDGVRASWNGALLTTRSGRKIYAPHWFIEALPNESIEGELWLGRNQFDQISALVRREDPNDPLWVDVIFMVFDMPQSSGNFMQRQANLSVIIEQIDQPWLMSVPRFDVASELDLQNQLSELVAMGGEGFMLNRKDGIYSNGRTASLVKLKPIFDDEALVIGYTKGKGKYAGKVGALIVQLKDGRTMKLGSGLSDDERSHPPALNSWVQYQYSGYTSTGLPRFARFIRIHYPL